MRLFNLTKGFLLAALVLMLAAPAWAQDDSAVIAPGWFLMQGRFGATADTGGGSFSFDEVPRTTNADKDTPFGSNVGYLNVSGIDFMFFPTAGRGFLLGASLEHQAGYTVMQFKDDEYGYEIGLDNRQLTYQLNDVALNIGYRWLRGAMKQHAISLFARVGGGSAGMSIDGFASGRGAAGVATVTTNYMRRFDNKMAIGVQLDLRGWGAGFSGLDVESLDTKTDLGLGGGTGLISFVIGWEPI